MPTEETPSSMVELVTDVLLPIYQEERQRLDTIDRWARWDHDKPHVPRASTAEYKELIGRAETPWGALVVTAVAQSLYVEGYRDDTGEDAAAWSFWQDNGMDRRQAAVHRAAVGYGTSYVSVLPGLNIVGEPMPVIRGISPRNMIAFYDEDDLDGDWPELAMRVDPLRGGGHKIRVYDSMGIHSFIQSDNKLTPAGSKRHDLGICPIVRFTNQLDLEGRSFGEVEPYIPVLARIDQTIFDRLVTQRFNSWIVRTVTGMAQPESDEEEQVASMRLRQEDLLVAESPDTKFGSLPASDLAGFIAAKDADLRDLAAVTQTPPHHLVGQVSNLSAEALAGAEATLHRKVEERRHSFGESWEQVLRLAAHVDGDEAAAKDTESQVRWRDIESRSLAQTADALGKMATMLGVPLEALWERIPGVTQQDVEAWKSMKEEDALDMLVNEVRAGLVPAEQPGVPGAQPSEQVDSGTGLQ